MTTTGTRVVADVVTWCERVGGETGFPSGVQRSMEKDLNVGRLRLRRPVVSDAKAWELLSEVPDIDSFVSPGKLGDVIDGWSDLDDGWWERCCHLYLIDENATVVGLVGLARRFRNAGPHLLCGMLPGWRGAYREGESRALRACRRVLLLAKRCVPSVYAHVDPSNKKGARLAEALGGIRVAPSEEYDPEQMIDYHIL